MRLGFDVSPLHRSHPEGVVRATQGLVTALEARDDLEVERLVPPEGMDLRRWRKRELPERMSRGDLAGLHSPVSAFPLGGPGLRAQTVHELPWRAGVQENAGWRHRFWAAWGPVRADLVLCPSEHVARQLRKRMLPGASKVHVCPWGRDPGFTDEPPPGVIDEAIVGRLGVPEQDYALCLGAVREKKNLAAVLAGLERLHRRGRKLGLIVTGPESPDLRRDLGLASKLGLSRWVSTPGVVPEESLPSLIRMASVVPVLSRSEGFAFPVLEAMACGVPALVPKDSAQAELGGEGSIAVDAEDPEDVARGFEEVLEQRESLRWTAIDRAAPFTWERCAERVAGLWRDLR